MQKKVTHSGRSIQKDFLIHNFAVYFQFNFVGISGPKIENENDHRHCSTTCGNGTYCMRMLNSEFCVCDQNSTEKPAECYGKNIWVLT